MARELTRDEWRHAWKIYKRGHRVKGALTLAAYAVGAAAAWLAIASGGDV